MIKSDNSFSSKSIKILVMLITFTLLSLSTVNADGWVAMEMGATHTVMISSYGTVHCTGGNIKGQAGSSSKSEVNSVKQIDGIEGAVDIAAGAYSSGAVDSDGNVWTWGDNGCSQLGRKTDGYYDYKAKTVPNISDATNIAMGAAHTVVLLADGSVTSFGLNKYGQLGNGSKTNSLDPVKVDIADIINVECGLNHSLALDKFGRVWAWGTNEGGQLGNGTIKNSNIPVVVLKEGGEELVGIINISAGQYHSIAIDTQGNVYVWGSNTDGQLGLGVSTSSVQYATLLEGVIGENLATGNKHTIIQESDGDVVAFGQNTYNEISDENVSGIYTPTKIPELEDAKIIATGGTEIGKITGDWSIETKDAVVLEALPEGVDNIPTAPIITLSKEEFTTSSIQVTLESENSEVTVEYKINYDEWQGYSQPFEVNENCKISARSIKGDKTSGISQLSLSNIVSQLRVPLIKKSTLDTDSQSVLITIESHLDNLDKIEYKIDDGMWKRYKEPIELDYNATIYARSKFEGLKSDETMIAISNLSDGNNKAILLKLALLLILVILIIFIWVFIKRYYDKQKKSGRD